MYAWAYGIKLYTLKMIINAPTNQDLSTTSDSLNRCGLQSINMYKEVRNTASLPGVALICQNNGFMNRCRIIAIYSIVTGMWLYF